ncbi:MAG: ATP-dependent DNA helicase RecG, partial [Patescibacteria group bacterium]
RIADASLGEVATVQGVIEDVQSIRTWKRGMQLIHVAVGDASGAIDAVWFNQPFLLRTLTQGKHISISGKITLNERGERTMLNPAYEVLGENKTTTHTGRIVPVYSEAAGITSRWLRYLVKNAFAGVTRIDDTLPQEIIKRQRLPALYDALTHIHFPRTQKEADAARRRMAFEEMFLLQLCMSEARREIQQSLAPKIPFDLETVKSFVDGLPFQLTQAQRRAAWEILQDMEKSSPMNRLLEGDVGSGKTVVAAIAIINTAHHGWQSAVMAPTEVLARQHFASFAKLFSPFHFDVGLLTGSEALIYDSEFDTVRKMKKTDFLTEVRSGRLKVVVGTHALIASAVAFHALALAVLDEQHRFGVAQRASLAKRNTVNKALAPVTPLPHFLSMTATPIPRTLTLTIYGDLDISLLNEIPQGRKKIVTEIITPPQRQRAYDCMRAQVRAGRQIFVICPRIEGNFEETSVFHSSASGQIKFTQTLLRKEVKAVKEEYKKLTEEIFSDLRVGMLHGKMKLKEKETVMKQFKDGTIDVLVSTSVIEVGVDVPNAAVMAIEGAERFGLAQLHQFRGRVGRGEHQSHCFLFTESSSAETNRRLRALLECDDGFALAEKDLAIRGPGDFLGTHQWGIPDYMMASLTDAKLIKTAREEATLLLESDPDLQKHPALKARRAEIHERIHLE